jgi:secondary thiamine-phosphate synthase enzyme
VSARHRSTRAASRLSAIKSVVPEVIATATLAIQTSGQGFFDFTSEVKQFLAGAGAGDGTLIVFLRHTSASLVIQENADPAVLTDLATALDRLAPADAGWVHDAEGPDDMPAHVKTMLTGATLQIPVARARLALGTWQGIYLAEHRVQAHSREVVLQFIGSRC